MSYPHSSTLPATAPTTKPDSPRKEKHVAVFDIETDPFQHDSEIAPFALGFKDATRYLRFWGDDCLAQFLAFLETEEPMLMYAHNGGKFDFLFFADELENPIKLIGSRIVKAKLRGHEIRDSYAILPVPLKAHDKGEIDYDKFTKENRERHKDEISEYLKRDCDSLYSLVTAFIARFGPKLTAASNAMTQLRLLHKFEQLGMGHHAIFRPFYFGGRCQHFESGRLEGDWKVYDVNSMYPHTMRDYDHPEGATYLATTDFDVCVSTGKPFFAQVIGRNDNALPVRTKTGLSFTQKQGEFFACSHELLLAVAQQRFVIERVIQCYVPDRTTRFASFIDRFTKEKIVAEQAGDVAGRLFAKITLNAAYGKFAQNPLGYNDYLIRRAPARLPGWPWEIHHDGGDYEIWRKPAPGEYGWYDVAIAASITSASRSVLFQALLNAKRPVYCDTDAIICEGLRNTTLDATKLGAWKTEAQGDVLHIAGKKMYALYDHDEPVKWASKGVRVAPEIIVQVAAGREYLWKSDAPSINIMGDQKFLQRRINKSKTELVTFR